jgi:hypothetical protein
VAFDLIHFCETAGPSPLHPTLSNCGRWPVNKQSERGLVGRKLGEAKFVFWCDWKIILRDF